MAIDQDQYKCKIKNTLARSFGKLKLSIIKNRPYKL